MTGALEALDRWLQAPAPAERLALLRIAIGGFVTVWLIASVGEVDRLADRSGAEFDPIGVLSPLDAPLAAWALWLGWIALVFLGIAFTVGIGFRIVGPLFGLGVLAWSTYHSSWGRLLHFEHLFTIHVLLLGLAPSADALAIRRTRMSDTAPPDDDVRYGWPVRLMAFATVTSYALSGLAKLRFTGTAWFGPDVLADHIAYSATRIETVGGPTPPLAAFVLANDWLIPPMAIAALAIELGAPLALVDRRLRNVWAVGAIGFHAMTGLTMWVFFGYRGLGFGLLPLFAVEGWRRAAAVRLSRGNPLRSASSRTADRGRLRPGA